jgi:hypothetical protein
MTSWNRCEIQKKLSLSRRDHNSFAAILHFRLARRLVHRRVPIASTPEVNGKEPAIIENLNSSSRHKNSKMNTERPALSFLLNLKGLKFNQVKNLLRRVPAVPSNPIVWWCAHNFLATKTNRGQMFSEFMAIQFADT